jgi:sugar lactone lactonase YvrE
MMPSAAHRETIRPHARGAGLLLALSATLPILLAASRAFAMGMGNNSPVIDDFSASPLTVGKGAQAALVCVAHDTDGTLSEYQWTATAGTFPGGAATETTTHPANAIQWTAPVTPGLVTFTCTVTDDKAASSATHSVDVTVVDSWAPVIASVTPSDTPILPGASVEIVCAATDPDGDTFTYAWTASGGTVTGDADADPERVTWTAPPAGGTYAVTVTTTDDKGAASADFASIVVRFAEHEASFEDIKMKVPLRVAVAPWGEYFVTGKGRVIVFDADGTLAREIVGLEQPLSLAISADGELYVGEAGTGGIRAFDHEGAFLREIAPPGSLRLPSDMCLDGQGLLYVTDGKVNCVMVYSVDGGEVFSFGAPGSADGKFRFPTGIAYDAAGDRILVCDQMNKRLQIFGPDGEHLTTIDNSGSIPVNFAFVQGLAFGPAGRIFVADSFQGHLGTMNDAGEWLGTVGSYGTAPGQLKLPSDVSVDPTGKLVVTSTSTGRLEVFKLLGETGAYTDPPATKGGGGLGSVTLPFGEGCGASSSDGSGSGGGGGGAGALALLLALAAGVVCLARRKAGQRTASKRTS